MNGEKADILQKIPIKEIKDGVIIMKDTSLRGVLMVSSANFALKSAQEQDALTMRYQEFLNSLDFPIQILVITRRFDVTEYLSLLEQKRNEQENELLKIQTGEYIDFIKGLTQIVNIMSTFFYVVIGYAQSEPRANAGLTDKITGLFKKESPEQQTQTYEQMRAALWQRIEYISAGLTICNLKSAALNDQELTELFYRLYNPQAKEAPAESAKETVGNQNIRPQQ
ncbi:MAG: hypothetical protein V1684_02440 [bacterium]